MTLQTGSTPVALACACAVVLGLWLGFPNSLHLTFPLLVLLYPAGVAVLGHGAPSYRQAFLRGFVPAAAGHVLALSWLSVPLSQVGGLPMAGAIPCAILVSLALATQAGLFAMVARRLWLPAWPSSGIALALVWYFLEYAYALVAGFPWLPLAGALAVWPWTIQIADAVGANLAGALWASSLILLAGGLISGRRRTLFAAFLMAAHLTGFGLYDLARHPEPWSVQGEAATQALPEASSDPDLFPVLLVEGNIDQNQKWVEAYRVSTVQTYVSLTAEAVARAREHLGEAAETTLGRGLVIWPETAMPFDLPRSKYTNELVDLVRTIRMPLLTGAPGTEYGADGRPRVFNRVWLMDANGYPAGSYDKEHLVPFGEYVPAFFRWSFLEGLLQEVGAYTAGTRTAPLRLNGLAMGPLVCYEAIFPWLAQERVAQGANVLVDVSNDGWFGDTPAPRQHLALTSLRAVEQNRWLVRCTNTGISAVIDPRGRVVFAGPQFRAGALWAQAGTRTEPSRFHLLHPFLPPGCALLFLGLVWRSSRISRRHAATE